MAFEILKSCGHGAQESWAPAQKRLRTGWACDASLIVLPDDSAKPIVRAIERAKKSLRVKMFLFSDPTLLKAVIAAKKRGVKVRVMLNPARRNGESENKDSRSVWRPRV